MKRGRKEERKRREGKKREEGRGECKLALRQ